MTNLPDFPLPKRPAWQAGKYIDIWSVNHLLAGLLLGSFLFLMSVPFIWSFLIVVLLSIGWEVSEVILNIKEPLTNSMMDLVLDVAGFFVASYFFILIGKPLSIPIVIVLAIVFIVLEIFGFTTYLVWRNKKAGE
jgi:hypothetical protein